MAEENKTPEPNFVHSEGDIPSDVLETMNNIISDPKYGDSVEVTDDDTDTTDTVDDTVDDDSDAIAEDTTDVVDTTEDATDDDYEAIDPRLVDAARRFGWSDEKIIRVAEDDETILEDLANLVERQIEQNSIQQQSTQEKVDESTDVPALEKFELNDEEFSKLKDTFGDENAKLIKGLSERMNTAIDRLNEVQGDVSSTKRADQDRAAQSRMEHANKAFDKMSETFPVLSKTNELPKLQNGNYDTNNPAFKARAELFTVAEQFTTLGLSFEKAMDEAFNWFAGKRGSKHVEDKVVKELNARKKQFTARPTHKKTEKKFSSKEEKAEHVMDEIYNKLGIEPD
jgi:hypothetical protein